MKYSIGIYSHYQNGHTFYTLLEEINVAFICDANLDESKPHLFRYEPQDQFCYPEQLSNLHIVHEQAGLKAVIYDEDIEGIATTEMQKFDEMEEAEQMFNRTVKEGSKEVHLVIILKSSYTRLTDEG